MKNGQYNHSHLTNELLYVGEFPYIAALTSANKGEAQGPSHTEAGRQWLEGLVFCPSESACYRNGYGDKLCFTANFLLLTVGMSLTELLLSNTYLIDTIK